jgi:dolichol kinase
MGIFNYKRKLFHLLGFILPYLYYIDIFKDAFGLTNASRAIIFSILMFQGLVLVTTEYLRLKNLSFKKWFSENFGALMKKEEETRMNATIPYMLSNAIVVLFFPPEFYFLRSWLFLLIGDPVAAFFGANYGKIPILQRQILSWRCILYHCCLSRWSSFYGNFSKYKRRILYLLFSLKNGLNYKALTRSPTVSYRFGANRIFLRSCMEWFFLDDNLTIPLAAAFTLAVAFCSIIWNQCK